MSLCNEPSATPSVAVNFRYYDFVRLWTKRIEAHLGDKKLNDILVRDFNKFTYGRCQRVFTYGDLPCDFESCDWRFAHRGREPRYWRYVRHAAAHWLVNFNLRLAMLSEPKDVWRIVTSPDHSTVWNGKDVLFDMTFSALGIDPNDAWQLANKKGRVLPPGKSMPVYFAEHYRFDVERNRPRLGLTDQAEEPVTASSEDLEGREGV